MLETLFKSIQGIDEKVFTPELKERLNEMFDEAVDTKAKLIAEDLVESEKASLQDQAEQYKAKLEESFKDYTENYKEKLAESVDAFLNSIVENFVKEKSQQLDEIVKTYKSSALLQLFEKSNDILGRDLIQVMDPSCNESSNLNKYNSLKESYNELSEENNRLTQKNKSLMEDLMNTIRAAIVSEKTRDLTVVQQDSVEKLIEMYNKGVNVDNFKPLEYAEKIDEICETIHKKPVSENKRLAHLRESKSKSGNSQSWRRFV